MIVIINIFKFQYLAMKKKLIKISCGYTHTQTDVSETLYNIICFAIAKYHIASMQWMYMQVCNEVNAINFKYNICEGM